MVGRDQEGRAALLGIPAYHAVLAVKDEGSPPSRNRDFFDMRSDPAPAAAGARSDGK
jgi:hypothetical protein